MGIRTSLRPKSGRPWCDGRGRASVRWSNPRCFVVHMTCSSKCLREACRAGSESGGWTRPSQREFLIIVAITCHRPAVTEIIKATFSNLRPNGWAAEAWRNRRKSSGAECCHGFTKGVKSVHQLSISIDIWHRKGDSQALWNTKLTFLYMLLYILLFIWTLFGHLLGFVG